MEQVASSAGEAHITPFWQRIPLFFRYPLHPEPLLYMLLLAAASLLAFVLPVPAPFDLLIVLCGVARLHPLRLQNARADGARAVDAGSPRTARRP